LLIEAVLTVILLSEYRDKLWAIITIMLLQKNIIEFRVGNSVVMHFAGNCAVPYTKNETQVCIGG